MQNLLNTREESPKKLSHKDPRLSSRVFPRCHLHLAVNLRWTCQLSSLITDWPTCFPANSPPSATQREGPPFVPLLLPSPVRIRKHLEEPEELVWAASTVPPPVSEGNVQACVVFVMVERTAARHGWAWWDVAELQRRPLGLWTITGMWEPRREGLHSQLSPKHRGLSGDGDLSDHVAWFLCPHDELWIELWARGDGSDVRAETDFGPQRMACYGNGNIRCGSRVYCKLLAQVLKPVSKWKHT